MNRQRNPPPPCHREKATASKSHQTEGKAERRWWTKALTNPSEEKPPRLTDVAGTTTSIAPHPLHQPDLEDLSPRAPRTTKI
uniref:Uncharacterized protein n=1 Tax=Noccaea caerulescens TaxID=107243 RepID=A0A1J3KAM9_NOCCA